MVLGLLVFLAVVLKKCKLIRITALPCINTLTYIFYKHFDVYIDLSFFEGSRRHRSRFQGQTTGVEIVDPCEIFSWFLKYELLFRIRRIANRCGLDLHSSIIGVQMRRSRTGVIIRIGINLSSCQCLIRAGVCKKKTGNAGYDTTLMLSISD